MKKKETISVPVLQNNKKPVTFSLSDEAITKLDNHVKSNAKKKNTLFNRFNKSTVVESLIMKLK